MTIRSYLEKFAQETPQATALRYFEAKDWHTRSWADFLAGVRTVAEAYGPRFALRPRAENVALMLPNGPEWMEAYLACSGAGVGVVPLDPKLHSAEVEYILKDSGAVVVTTDKAHLDLMRLIAP
ncbi:MAG: class I adenylate-forming enzyme family protein, partial [bacterium]|nr:class I adenylate-forming enzyme family protein [bacterium]